MAVIQTYQPIEFVSDGAALHSVRGQGPGSVLFHKAVIAGASPAEVVFETPQGWVDVRCAVHGNAAVIRFHPGPSGLGLDRRRRALQDSGDSTGLGGAAGVAIGLARPERGARGSGPRWPGRPTLRRDRGPNGFAPLTLGAGSL